MKSTIRLRMAALAALATATLALTGCYYYSDSYYPSSYGHHRSYSYGYGGYYGSYGHHGHHRHHRHHGHHGHHGGYGYGHGCRTY